MIPTAADSILAITALFGTLAAMVVVRARSSPGGLATRFTFALALVAGILASRLLTWHLNAAIFDTIGRIFAAWIPLAALTLLEGLQRRHAPRLVKLAALVAGGLCTVLAFFSASLGFPNYVLLGVQVGAFITVYWLALTGNREGLTQSEIRALSRLRVALPIFLVFIASDYGLFAQWIPIRGSSIAILAFCWLAIGSSSATATRLDTLLVLGAATVLALLLGLATWVMTANMALAVQVGAMALCAAILVLVVNEASRAFAASRRDDVLNALATADMSNASRFMASVTEHSQLEGTTLIEGEALRDFDASALATALATTPVMDRGDLQGVPDDTRQQLESLFHTYDATHLLLISPRPLRLAAATLAAVGSSAALKTELAVMQRLALLISQQETRADGTA